MRNLLHQTHRFDGFTLDLTRGCLLRGSQEIKLRPKPFEALTYLVNNAGRLINKTELIEALWPDTAVTDDSLVQCLMEVRRALGDDAQQIIKTLPRRGYIFNKPVESGLTAAVTTYKEETAGVQITIEEEETNGRGAIETAPLPAAGSTALISESARGIARLTTAIKQHRLAVALGVLTLAVSAAAIVYFTRPSEAIDSIAVLPFTNVSGDPDIEYLSDGLSDNIISSLSQLPSLKTVISLSSVLRYKGKRIDPQAVGQELNVRAVLMGRVIQHGDDLSVNTELVDTRDNRRLWAHQYNRRLADIMAMQEDISLEISEKLRVKLSPEERKQLAKRYTGNVEAYRAFLQGYHVLLAGTAGAAEKGIKYFEEAIRIDPGYAPAYAALARAYYRGEDFTLLTEESRQKIESALRKALALDDTLADVHALLGAIRQDEGDWPEAEKEFKHAVELNPNGKGVHWYYARYLGAIGRSDEAIAEAKRGLEIDPLSPLRVAIVAYYYLDARQYDQAIELFRKALAMDPNYSWAHANLGRAYVQKGMYPEAIAELEMAKSLNPQARARFEAALAYTYSVSGKKAEAQKMLDELKERARPSYIAPLNFAIIYTGLGEKDRAFEWLEKAYKDRSGPPYLTIDLMLDSLRSDPRFAHLAQRKGLAR